MSLFWEIHKDIPREGPGEDGSTLKAFALLQDVPKQPKILDIGCGPGAQTIALAKETEGQIIAVDAHQPFLNDLLVRAQREGLSEKITAQKGNMFALEFEKGSFDLIWSEGAIYIMGFQRGLQEWREYLKDGGYLVVSEISWLRDDLPTKVKEFWTADYPGMQNIAGNLKIIEEVGYELIGHFTLPESGWWNEYYHPLMERIQMLREEYANNEEAQLIFGLTEKEIEMYREFSDCYGYEFYIMRKPK